MKNQLNLIPLTVEESGKMKGGFGIISPGTITTTSLAGNNNYCPTKINNSKCIIKTNTLAKSCN